MAAIVNERDVLLQAAATRYVTPEVLGTINFSNVTGATRPADYATVGANSSNLQVGPGANLLQNAGFSNSAGGYTYGLQAEATPADFVFFRNMEAWTLQGEGTLVLTQAGAAAFWAYLVTTPQYVPVSPGQRIELSAYTGAHRCTVLLGVDFVDSAGAFIPGGLVTDGQNENDAEALGGTTLAGYKRLWGFYTVPAGATRARLVLHKGPTFGGETSSYLFASRVYLGMAHAGQTEPSPWVGGAPNGTSQLADDANLGGTATWAGVSGTTGAVNTIHLTANAATIPAAATAASYTITTTPGNAVSVNITAPAGTPIQVTIAGVGECQFSATGSGFAIYYEIVKDGSGTPLWYGYSHDIMNNTYFGGQWVSIPLAATILDTAADGSSHTYALRVRHVGTGGGAFPTAKVTGPAITVLAVKR